MADRMRLAITTIGAIDCPKNGREARRRLLDRERKMAARLKANATPREKSASRLKPWLALSARANKEIFAVLYGGR